MKTRIAICFLSVLSLLMLNNCNENTSPTPTGTDVIMPLAVGNMWIGKHNYYRYDSTLETRFSGYDTTRIQLDTIIDGEQWYKQSDEYYLQNVDDGLRIIDKIYSKNPYIGCKFPAVKGDTFNTAPKVYIPDQNNPLVLDSGFYYVQITNTDTIITVPKGSFSCYEYKTYLLQFGHTEPKIIYPIFYYSPNIGQVKRVTNRINPQGNLYLYISWELVDYQLY
jgi:hypothetical protein